MIQIYTDGACSPNPGKGGWGVIIKFDTSEIELSGYEENSTNQRMELTSAIKALDYVNNTITNGDSIELYSDSQYLINTMNLGWKKNANIDLWQQLENLVQGNDIKWIWVKGHASNCYNNRCDQLAVRARLTNKSESNWKPDINLDLNVKFDTLTTTRRKIYVCSPLVQVYNELFNIDHIKVNDLNLKYVITDLYDSIYQMLVNHRAIALDNQSKPLQTIPSSFMFAYKDKCFRIDHEGADEEINDYLVMGSGDEIAIGVLEANKDKSPEERIKEAIKACSDKTLYINNNVKILTT